MSSLSFVHALEAQKKREDKRKMHRLLSDVTSKIDKKAASTVSNFVFLVSLLSTVAIPFLLKGLI